jgi:hypothetical protein
MSYRENEDDKKQGSLEDPVLIGAVDVFEWIEDMTNDIILSVVRLHDMVVDSAESPRERAGKETPDSNSTDSMFYDLSTGFWHRIFSETTPEGWLYSESDSIRLFQAGNHVKWPDPMLVDRIDCGVYAVQIITPFSAPDTIRTLELEFNISSIPGAIFERGNILVSGVGGTNHWPNPGKSEDSSACHHVFVYIDLMLTSLSMNLASAIDNQACPESGIIDAGGRIELLCTTDTTYNLSQIWSMKLKYHGDQLFYEIENPDFRWEFSEPCLNLR